MKVSVSYNNYLITNIFVVKCIDTSQIININVINTSCLDIYIQCCYRTPSILWECGIKVNNSNDLTIYNLMVSSNTTINVSHIGNYSIYVYNCYNMTCNYDHVIHHMTANVTDNCIATSTDISPSVTPSNSKLLLDYNLYYGRIHRNSYGYTWK